VSLDGCIRPASAGGSASSGYDRGVSEPRPNNAERSHPLEPLVLDQADPCERGRAHGEHWRAAIQELSELRLGLTLRRSGFLDEDEVLAAAGLHLPVLRERLPRLAQELEGIAEGAGLAPERLVVLNQYTDLRDIPRSVLGRPEPAAPRDRPEAGDPDGCTAVYFMGERGPLLGETWDLHADAEPYVRMLRIAPAGSEHETLCLTLAGCLGAVGISGCGVAVTINNLSSTDARVGVIWPALVRAMLEKPCARAAYELLMRTPLSSGHHYVIADGHDYYGVECSGELKVLTQLGPRAAHLHTNHCFDPVLRRREAVPAGSTSFHRLNLATTLYAQARPRDEEGMWTLLHTRDGSVGSLCIDPRPDAEPTATATVAVIVMRLADGWVRVVRGGAHRGEPLELAVGRWRGQPATAYAAGR
jgi:isopenicillin-N N-acyltransferase-like protein